MSGLGLIGGIAGSITSAVMSRKLQEDAQAHQERMYKARYQWTMRDMEKAGLNPILAYQQGAGAAGSAGPIASVPNFGDSITSGMEKGASTAKKKAEEEKTTEELKNVKLGQDLLNEQILATSAAGLKDQTQAGVNLQTDRLTSARATQQETLTPAYKAGGGMIGGAVGGAMKYGRRMWDAHSPNMMATAEEARQSFQTLLKNLRQHEKKE